MIDTTINFYTLEKTYPITMNELDMQYRIKPASLLNLMQDTASRNIAGTPFGNVELNNEGLGWFLVRYRIEFDNYPSHIDEIRIQTENRGTLRQSAYRDFEVFAPDNSRILRATTYWLMVDLETKSLVNIEERYPEITKFQKRDNDLQLQRLKSQSEYDREQLFHVRYQDLDMNGHVNNTVYIAWAMEVLGLDFLQSHKIKALDIYYKQEVRYGEDILSCVKFNENTTEHLIKNALTGEELCLIRAEFI